MTDGNDPRTQAPDCERCGEQMVLQEEDTMMGDKYGCKNKACLYYVEDDPDGS